MIACGISTSEHPIRVCNHTPVAANHDELSEKQGIKELGLEVFLNSFLWSRSVSTFHGERIELRG